MNNSLIRQGADKDRDEISMPFRSQLGPLVFLAGIFLLNFISRIILAPLSPAMGKDLGISHGEAGSFFLLISLGYFIALLGSGFVSSRFTHRKTIIFSATAVGMAVLIVALSKNMWTFRFGLLLLGMAAGLYLPSGIATLTSMVNPRHWGKAIAIHELAPNLSFVMAPLVCEALLAWFSWRGVLAILGAISLFISIAFAVFGKGGRFTGEPPTLGSSKTLFVEPAFWIMIILFSLAIAGSLGVYTMLPLYLTAERGVNSNWANTLIALSRISGVGVSFLAGWANDRLGPRQTIGAVFLLTGLTTVFLGILPGSWIVIAVFLQPAVAVCFFPPGFAALSTIGPPSTRNVAVSLTVPVAFMVGAGAIPTLIGVMGDAGSFGMGIALVGGLILLGFVLSIFLKFPDIEK